MSALQQLLDRLEETPVIRYMYIHKDYQQKGVGLQFTKDETGIKFDIIFMFDTAGNLTVNSAYKVRIDTVSGIPFPLMGVASRVWDKVHALLDNKFEELDLFPINDANVTTFELVEEDG